MINKINFKVQNLVFIRLKINNSSMDTSLQKKKTGLGFRAELGGAAVIRRTQRQQTALKKAFLKLIY